MGRYYDAPNQSSPVTNLVAELNSAIGQPYFNVKYYSHERLYELKITELGLASKKYNYLATGEKLKFLEMFQYLNGILLGIRLTKEIYERTNISTV